MKSKYYPLYEFMEASLGSYHSFTWHSIWAARDLLDKGTSWRDENGQMINIWNDAWLLYLGEGKIRN